MWHRCHAFLLFHPWDCVCVMVGTEGNRIQPPVNQSLESFDCTPLLSMSLSISQAALYVTNNLFAWGTIATCWKLLTEREDLTDLRVLLARTFVSWSLNKVVYGKQLKKKKKEHKSIDKQLKRKEKCRAKKREGKASQAKPPTKGLETSLRLFHFPPQMRHREDLSLGDRDKSYRCLASCLRTTVYFFNEVWDQNSINSHSSRSRQELVSGAIQGAQHHSLRIREVHSWLKIGLERSHF